MQELWDIVTSIPRGRVCSYGDVGAALRNPMSGFLVGRRMASAPADVPWWRVVAKGGTLPVGKRHPRLMSEQEERLREEGVPFSDRGVVEMESARWTP
ncbi:MAG: MGMT family protein [Armatimonadota bacterium]|nr:MGMT family protein [Armatimonadota bacterium]